MANYGFDPDELLKERSLWDIYKATRRIQAGKLNSVVVILVMFCLFISTLLVEMPTATLAKSLKAWAVFGFQFTISTLGFLIAGFTIFATLSKPSMLLAMMDHFDETTQMPTLKRNFFSFMRIFIHYIFFAIVFALVQLFTQSDGIIVHIVNYISADPSQTKRIIVQTFYAIIGAGVVHLLLLLNTFVYNIFHIVMTSLRWEYEMKK